MAFRQKIDFRPMRSMLFQIIFQNLKSEMASLYRLFEMKDIALILTDLVTLLLFLSLSVVSIEYICILLLKAKQNLNLTDMAIQDINSEKA